MVDPREQLQSGLADRYRIERELGRGGMATVYLARDVRHDRLVALKVLRHELSITLGAARFLREIQLTARLQHAGILPLFDSGEADGQLWYAMPYVEGGSLRDRLRRQGQLPLEAALEIAQQVLAALAAAHAQGIVHRDIKPENILLSGSGAMVADFGIAQAVSAVGTERLTETGLAIGTAAYMSPEQSMADPRLDERTDLYAVGCVLYEMLAGEPPYTGPSAQAIIAKRLTEPIPHLRTVRNVPRAVEAAITRALERAPADRFVSAAAFAAALRAAAAAPRPTRTEAMRPQRRARRRVWVAAALGTLAVGGAALAARGPRRAPVYVPGRVIVAPLENQTGDTAVDEFAQRLLTTLPDAIAREGVGDPVPAATVRDLLARATGSPGEVADRLARQTGAGLELRGVCTRGEATIATCQVDVLRMPAKVLRMSVSLSGDPAAPAFGAGLIERVLVALLLQRTYGEQASWEGEYIPTSLAALRAFHQGWEDGTYFGEAARLDTTWAHAAAASAVQDSSSAAAETILVRLLRQPRLLSGERDNVAWYLSAQRTDADATYRITERRVRVNFLWWFARLTAWAMLTNRPHRALEASRYQDTALALFGGGPDFGFNGNAYLLRGYALHQLGRYREELELAHDLQRRFPDRVHAYRTHEAMALAALGHVDTLRVRLAGWEATPESGDAAGTRALIAGQELMAHGHEREGLEMIAGTVPFYRRLRERGEGHGGANQGELAALHVTGRFADARRLAHAALKASANVSDSLTYLAALGGFAAVQGRRAEAERYERLIRSLEQRSGDPDGPFRRAYIAARLGDREGAVRLLEQARAQGSSGALHLSAHREAAFANLRDYPPFKRFLEPRD